MKQQILSLLALGCFIFLAFGSSEPPDSSLSASSSTTCSNMCDPMGGGNKYMDEAYENAYSPCLDEAVRNGKTADELQCSDKANQYCINACERDQ